MADKKKAIEAIKEQKVNEPENEDSIRLLIKKLKLKKKK